MTNHLIYIRLRHIENKIPQVLHVFLHHLHIWHHVNIRLATVVLDAMDEEDITELVDGCVAAAKAKDWSN